MVLSLSIFSYSLSRQEEREARSARWGEGGNEKYSKCGYNGPHQYKVKTAGAFIFPLGGTAIVRNWRLDIIVHSLYSSMLAFVHPVLQHSLFCTLEAGPERSKT
jgi:hypothetical protein